MFDQPSNQMDMGNTRFTLSIQFANLNIHDLVFISNQILWTWRPSVTWDRCSTLSSFHLKPANNVSEITFWLYCEAYSALLFDIGFIEKETQTKKFSLKYIYANSRCVIWESANKFYLQGPHLYIKLGGPPPPNSFGKALNNKHGM